MGSMNYYNTALSIRPQLYTTRLGFSPALVNSGNTNSVQCQLNPISYQYIMFGVLYIASIMNQMRVIVIVCLARKYHGYTKRVPSHLDVISNYM